MNLLAHVDLSEPRRIHIVGIGGAGMSAIAGVLAATGHSVTGSDLAMSQAGRRLQDLGVTVVEGHSASNVGQVDLVVHSTAIPMDNPELSEARQRGIPTLRRAEMLAAITRIWNTAAVAGTHGKTTTSAMLAWILRYCGLRPNFIIGGDIVGLGTGFEVGGGDHLVVEADESDGTFVTLDASAVIVTNVEPDHLEHYGGFEALEQAFDQFVSSAKGPRVVCLDDEGSARLAKAASCITYGTSVDADWCVTDTTDDGGTLSVMVEAAQTRVQFTLRQPGLHNALNATAALAAGVALGVDPVVAAEALSSFGGVGRRFERRGEAGGVEFIDDYAHLPTEVKAAIAAARSIGAERLVTVFQPHRYSRTEQVWRDFHDAFEQTDVLFVTGIYSSGEQPRPGITGRLVANSFINSHPDADVRYVEQLDDLAETLAGVLNPGDLCLTLGAGDLTHIPDRVQSMLKEARGGT